LLTASVLQAWSNIVHTLIPNASILSKHLAIFAQACGATEVILFERTTFLVIATSSSGTGVASSAVPTYAKDGSDHRLEPTRYERTSELIKSFKCTCSRVREEFHALELDLHDFSAVLDELTKNTYVLVILHDPTIGASVLVLVPSSRLIKTHHIIETAAVRLNIRLARSKFETLQADSLN